MRLEAHAASAALGKALVALLAAAALTPAANAGISSRYCDTEARLTLEHKDRLLGVAAVIRGELEKSGAEVALLSRSGLDLGRWGIRHSHAGLSLKSGTDSPWSVRQLYYACEEQMPRIFDQGLAAFIFGADRPDLGYYSLVLLPPAAGRRVHGAALDNPLALALLAGRYSANAYAFNLRYQNCNQWLVELLAAAWAGVAPGPDARERAQRWLAEQRYQPTSVEVGWRLVMWAGVTFVRWLHDDDHPAEDLEAARYRISLPAALEGLMRAQVPEATRIEFCHTTSHVLVRRGWGAPLAEGCVAEAGDEVIALE